MQIYLVKSFIGIFAVDDNKKIILFKPFPKNPTSIAGKLSEPEPSEIKQLKKEISDKNPISGNKSLEDFIKQNLHKLAVEYKFVKNQQELNQLLAQINSELTKTKIKESGKRDTLIINVNNAIEELDKIINVSVERLRELYSLHFPELDKYTQNHEAYAKLVEKYGSRENFTDGEIRILAERSVGIGFTKDDESIAKSFANNVVKLYELRKELSNYLTNILKELAPNFSALAGDSIAAKLIAKAGGIERLSKMPSSTIQLLGSEKALFRFLKSRGRSKSPKYGLIYNHPLIQSAPQDKQGKIARLLASKLSIAARIDYYSKDNKSDEMKRELERKVRELG